MSNRVTKLSQEDKERNVRIEVKYGTHPLVGSLFLLLLCHFLRCFLCSCLFNRNHVCYLFIMLASVANVDTYCFGSFRHSSWYHVLLNITTRLIFIYRPIALTRQKCPYVPRSFQ